MLSSPDDGRTSRAIGRLLFFAFFALYVATASPYLAPYRDAGEMATAAHTLGVAHPPSYPLYVLLGKLSQALPFGSPAFRLTLFSAAAAAAAAAVLFRALAAPFGLGPAALAALWLGASRTFWSVAVVQEMYALSLLQAALLLGLALKLRGAYDPRPWRGFAFLYGLSLGNRTDLLLLAPGLFVIALGTREFERVEPSRAGWLKATAGWGLLGLTIYLYLPLRSAAGPWLDWNHPAELSNLIGSLTRRSYGGTLDLLSRNYAAGALFDENLLVYARRVYDGFLGPLFWLPAAGWVCWWRRSRLEAVGLALAYAAAGPLFLFLANLPPNPHALAIVEPHYLLSDLILAALGAAAASSLWRWASDRTAEALGEPRAAAARPALAAAALAAGLTPLWREPFESRRWNLFNHDYTRNALASAPRGAAVAAKKDVPLFSLWYAQAVEGLRPDVRLVAQGLAGSAWYQRSRRRLGDPVPLGPLRSAADWRDFGAKNAHAFATTDCDFPHDLRLGAPRGLLLSLSTASAPSEAAWRAIARRGEYRYDGQPDFFGSDIVEAYAQSHHRLGAWHIERGEEAPGGRQVRLAWAMKYLMPEAPVFLAFSAFRSGRMTEAAEYYRAAASLFARTLELAAEYRSLPELVSNARHGAAEAHLNYGVVLEKLGDKPGAEAHYRESLRLSPGSSQAHFNLAVLYWDRDWSVVAAEMSEALRLDPRRQDAAKYLEVARHKLGLRPGQQLR